MKEIVFSAFIIVRDYSLDVEKIMMKRKSIRLKSFVKKNIKTIHKNHIFSKGIY